MKHLLVALTLAGLTFAQLPTEADAYPPYVGLNSQQLRLSYSDTGNRFEILSIKPGGGKVHGAYLEVGDVITEIGGQFASGDMDTLIREAKMNQQRFLRVVDHRSGNEYTFGF